EWNEGIGGSLGILDFRMICPADTTLLLDENCSVQMPDFTHEACEGGSVTQSVPPGTPLSHGVYPVSIYTSDINGQQDSCSFNVSVIDQTPPFFLCPDETTLSTDENCQAHVPDFTDIEGFDNCDGITEVIQSMAPGHSIYENTTLTLTSVDASGNQMQCEVQLILNDTEPPSYPCPDDDIRIVNSDCSWSMPNYTFMRFPIDNCSSDFNVTQTPTPGTTYTSGQEVQVEIVVDDTSGNQTFCNFTVLAYDLNTPIISCIEDQEAHVSNMCDVLLPDFTPQISYSGTCSEVELIQSPAPGSIISQSGDPIFVEIEARSINGTSATCSFNYTVIDNEAAAITCENSSITADDNCIAIIPNLRHSLFVSEECNPPEVTQFPLAGDLVELNDSPIEVEFTVIDESGNSSSCVSFLIIEDNSPPLLSCPEETFEVYITENGVYNVEDFSSELEIEENCSVPIDVDQWPIQGEEIQDIGVQQIEFTVEDSSGNQNSCQISIEVIDTISPTITALETVEVSLDDNCGFLFPDLSVHFESSDNFSDNLVSTQSPLPGSYFSSTVDNAFTIQVEDESGNTATYHGVITFIDDIEPTVSCPESIELILNESCLTTMPDMQEHVLFTDNCDSELTFVQSIQAGSVVQLADWPLEVIVEISDEAMNSSQCSVALQAIDSISPQIICPEGGVFTATTNCTAQLNLGQPEVSDACSAVTYELVGGSNPNGEFEVGTYFSEYQALDTHGNTASCTVHFIVTDSIPPILNCVAPVQISLGESCEIAAPAMDPEALVECSEVTWA
ncbi:MAG: HYR domain-containing protein, partial [Flavobacteriales bacterium]